MVVIYRGLTDEQADTYRLVLYASNTVHFSVRSDDGWNILVHERDAEKAITAIEQYRVENEGFNSAPPEDEYHKTYAGLWMGAVLLFFHIAITLKGDNDAFINAYGSSAHRVLNGEYFRLITALLLHGDIAHLAGNIVGIGIFGTAVCSTAGAGVGGLLILVTGIAGNYFNAMFYETGHLSIGASTAVFGAVGLLSGHQFCRKFRGSRKLLKALIPLGSGIALLALIGSGKHTDIMAHLFGFLVGIIIGAIFSMSVKRQLSFNWQAGAMVISFGLIFISWIMGFR